MNARPVLPVDLAGAVARAGVDTRLEGRELQDAIRSAIADRRGYCRWDVDHAGWVVTLHQLEEQTFHGCTLEARCLQAGRPSKVCVGIHV